MNWRVLVLCVWVSSQHGLMSKTLVLSAQRCTGAAERETAIMCLGSVCSPVYQVPSLISVKSLMSIYMYIFHMYINIHSVWAIAICQLSVSRLKNPPMTNEYLRACLQTKETHYYMKETQQINCRPPQMKARVGGGVQLIHTQQSIPIFFWPHHPSLVLCSLSPSPHILPFIIDQQTRTVCVCTIQFWNVSSWFSHSFARFSHLVIWVYSSENV